MTRSEQVTYLPIVAAIAGAFIGAVATGLFGMIRGWWQRRRERRALLLLIDAEVYGHILMYLSLQEIDLDELEFDASGLYTPRTEHWDELKGRLAQLLPVNHMKKLVIYYKYLKDSVAATSPEGLAMYRLTTFIQSNRKLLKQATAIREEGRKYLKELPSYVPEWSKPQQRQS